MNSRETLIALRRIMRAIDLHSKQLERSVGLTVPQLLVLRIVQDQQRPAVGDVVREVHLSQGTVTAIIDRLEAKSLVRRAPHERDGRKVCVLLTAAGKAKLDGAPEMLQEDFIQRFEKLTSWEQKMLTASLERVAELMDAEAVDASPILDTGDIVASLGSEPEPKR